MNRFDNRNFDSFDAAPRARAIFGWVADTLALIETWQRRQRASAQLARVDARVLRDAGISDAQRFVELNKPFWRQ